MYRRSDFCHIKNYILAVSSYRFLRLQSVSLQLNHSLLCSNPIIFFGEFRAMKNVFLLAEPQTIFSAPFPLLMGDLEPRYIAPLALCLFLQGSPIFHCSPYRSLDTDLFRQTCRIPFFHVSIYSESSY